MIFRGKQGGGFMDRQLAWLIAQNEKVFETKSPKLIFWGFALVIALVVALAVVGYPIRFYLEV
ncbi:hypothetical protein A3E63_00850 [Candidatus Giovannonibacteria bacterium RIFCSPHIGHO2_12_FULL_45_19]|uniref:Uncharacterized protein n=2 Tax=Candidatus Giovannoniibacteriota TaxID=1752738 RepID=A0A1F5WBM1_9BACT|nr:MAG: hypothetical protein A2W40_00750 [Candidatus Giovannonibacteria bacterium RIFCSPHIGHO2_01_45_12]OGF73033.1 MAG: hypothetical protein A3C05_04590 [Candidatus Giovannonibacteria bacterium RIFCSPHIGHO2_02_FULL_45_40]OGF84934.1 MAG: hypothetical protein A3E63_00850 [Candidatus Giovannonibacteria bacterium RIFCSPHIGHO2_12_FULL_45_19]